MLLLLLLYTQDARIQIAPQLSVAAANTIGRFFSPQW